MKDNINVAYVVTSSSSDAYADMAVVSALSVRISNPQVRIVVVCDSQSLRALQNSRHRLLDTCDHVQGVDTPAGAAIIRNRWIKTQLCDLVDGPTLNLDVDTLVVGSLSELTNLVGDFAGVPNHNGRTQAEQLWREDEQVCTKMKWLIDIPFYVNTGVLFYRSTKEVERFYKLWHGYWNADVRILGRGRDQPSCYAALRESRLNCIELPAAYNLQWMFASDRWREARILHFYPQPLNRSNAFGQVVREASRANEKQLNAYVKRSMERPDQPIYRDILSCLLRRNMRDSHSRVATGGDLWLQGERRLAVRAWLSAARRILAR